MKVVIGPHKEEMPVGLSLPDKYKFLVSVGKNHLNQQSGETLTGIEAKVIFLRKNNVLDHKVSS